MANLTIYSYNISDDNKEYDIVFFTEFEDNMLTLGLKCCDCEDHNYKHLLPLTKSEIIYLRDFLTTVLQTKLNK